jgi:UMF1 family MFS transporter
MGPAVFAFFGLMTGSGRYGILALVLFFVLGIFMLSTVNLNKGKQEAISSTTV